MKNRLTNYNFWISMFSAVLLILQALKIEFDVAYVNEIFTAVLGLLVVVGIIIDPTKTATKTTQQTEEKTVENNEKTSLPIDEKDETNNINNENDIQIVLNKISQDLQTKIKEMDAINKDTASMLVSLQQKEEIIQPTIEKIVQTSNEVEVNMSNEDEFSRPAVAEMENPYINLIN